jgi:hypothetical protein
LGSRSVSPDPRAGSCPETDRRQRQFWVDASGTRQEYEEGVYQNGALRFTGHNPGPKGEPVQQGFTFFNLDPNQVRQLQEQSTDGGKTWTVVYDFYYSRKTT